MLAVPTRTKAGDRYKLGDEVDSAGEEDGQEDTPHSGAEAAPSPGTHLSTPSSVLPAVTRSLDLDSGLEESEILRTVTQG